MSSILKKIGELLGFKRPGQATMTKMTEMESMAEMKQMDEMQQEPPSNDMAAMFGGNGQDDGDEAAETLSQQQGKYSRRKRNESNVL